MTQLHRRPPEPKPHSTKWKIWARSLGQKTAYNDIEADIIVWLRTIFVGIHLITCLFIIAAVIRYW